MLLTCLCAGSWTEIAGWDLRAESNKIYLNGVHIEDVDLAHLGFWEDLQDLTADSTNSHYKDFCLRKGIDSSVD